MRSGSGVGGPRRIPRDRGSRLQEQLKYVRKKAKGIGGQAVNSQLSLQNAPNGIYHCTIRTCLAGLSAVVWLWVLLSVYVIRISSLASCN